MAHPLKIHKGGNSDQYQLVWWKPLFTVQKNMARGMANIFKGTAYGGAVAVQEDFFEQCEEQVSKLFGEMFNNRQMMTPWVMGDQTNPFINIIDTKDAYKIKAELPGVKEADINIAMGESGIEIYGEKYEECAEKGENYLHKECHVGYFSRTIALPDDADPDRATATFNLSVVTVTVPKKASTRKENTKQIDFSNGNEKSLNLKAVKAKTKTEDKAAA